MEQGVLGCLLLDPALCLPQCLKRLNGRHAFYDLRHQEIYNACLSLYHQPAGIDLITLQQFLKDAGRLDQVGGIPYLASLPDAVPSAANLSYYLDILAEKHELRRIVQSCTEVVARIYDHAGPLDDLKFSVQSDLADVFGPTHNHADVLAGRKFNPDRQPPEIQPVYLLQDAVISTPGNLDSITSTIKTGKSAVLAAMFGSAMPHPDDTDLLSFSSANPNTLAIVHFDSEQAEDDHWRLIHRTLRRVALDRPPPWFNSYCLTGAGFTRVHDLGSIIYWNQE